MPVHLLGTFHPDIDEGPHKLLAAYELILPTLVLSETSHEELRHKESIRNRLFEQLSPLVHAHGILSALLEHDWGQGWEYGANVEYARKNGVQHLPVDIYLDAKRTDMETSYRGYLEAHVRAFREKEGPRSADALLLWVYAQANENRKRHLGELRGILSPLLEADNPSVNDCKLALGAGEIFGERDGHWEKTIRRHLADHHNAVIAFAVGGGHMLHSPALNTLYSRIRDLSPTRKLI